MLNELEQTNENEAIWKNPLLSNYVIADVDQGSGSTMRVMFGTLEADLVGGHRGSIITLTSVFSAEITYSF